MTIRTFRRSDEAVVIALWEACDLLRPQNDPREDIARKQAVQGEMFLVAEEGGTVVGTVMCGYEGHRGWINYPAVDPTRRRRGIGRTLMAEGEKLLRAAGCPKINLQVRETNEVVVAFYRALGFAVEEVVSMGKRLKKD